MTKNTSLPPFCTFVSFVSSVSSLILVGSVSQFSHAGSAVAYGKINLSLSQVTEEVGSDIKVDNIQLVSHESRFGVKGNLDISDDLTAIAKVEFKVAADGDLFDTGSEKPNGDPDGQRTLSPRDVYLGAKSFWGQLIAGRKDTPMKTTGKKAEVFNDYFLGDIKEVVYGENRGNNMLMYTTPKGLAGFRADLMMIMGEDGEGTATDNTGFADGISASVEYNHDVFSVGFAIDDNVGKDGLSNKPEQSRDILRLAGNVNIGPVRLGALVQESSAHHEDLYKVDDETAWLVSALWKVGQFDIKAQYGQGEIEAEDDVNDYERSLLVAGVDYKLAKTTKTYLYYAAPQYDYDENNTNGDEDIDEQTLGLGFEHKF